MYTYVRTICLCNETLIIGMEQYTDLDNEHNYTLIVGAPHRQWYIHTLGTSMSLR